MDRLRLVAVLAIQALHFAATARAEFQRGHIFVSASWSEACVIPTVPVVIAEIDPVTGTVTEFADADDHNMCFVEGLRFTPDGRYLLVQDYLTPTIRAFDSEGNSFVYLDASDGVFAPVGSNGLAFDAAGDLYVASDFTYIRCFPADGGPWTNFTDGVGGFGAMDFAPNGDLFFGGPNTQSIMRIAPDGTATAFDDPPATQRSLVVDRFSNLFVATGNGNILKYAHGNPLDRVVLASGFHNGAVARVLSLSPDHRFVYYANPGGGVYAIDAESGETRFAAGLSQLGYSGPAFVHGMTVHAPAVTGDTNGDGEVGLQDFELFHACITGPSVQYIDYGCELADLDHDGDVDLADFGLFQRVFVERRTR